MKKKPLGCLTANGLIAFVITLLLIGGGASINGGKMFAPGKLNAQTGESLGGVTSHADLSAECDACHAAPWGADKMGDRCMACHTEISAQLQNVSSLHGSLMQDVPDLQCRACHPEHRGPDASLVEMDPATFPHDAVGFALTAHAQKTDGTAFACGDCHLQNVASFEAAVCADCHQQIDSAFTEAHTAAYGSDCLACHDGVETYGANFDHNQAAFQLVGKHAAVNCADCHTNAHAIDDFKNTATECAACHQKDDPHNGNFGDDCSVCHTPEDWEATSFDHNLLAFKLEGKHGRVECEQCHINNTFKGTPTDCYACHQKDDQHNGQFGTDCAACHTPSDWDNVSFDHNSFAFPLEGKHARAECDECHTNNTFKGTPTDCYACHQKDDQHNGQFGTDCAACHNSSDWDNVSFDHNSFAFKLEGKHARVECEKCHVNNTFQGTPTDCYACHQKDDNHNGQFGTECGACHTPASWEDATFDHSLAAFPLTGAHVNVRCEKCHVNNTFAGTPSQCVACHADPAFHAGAFGADCASCHSTSGWRPAEYRGSHPGIADEGGFGIRHGNTTCRTCHTNTVRDYTCLACHSNNQGGEGGGDD